MLRHEANETPSRRGSSCPSEFLRSRSRGTMHVAARAWRARSAGTDEEEEGRPMTTRATILLAMLPAGCASLGRPTEGGLTTDTADFTVEAHPGTRPGRAA